MKQKIPYTLLLILALIMGAVHITGVHFYLYWQLSWYDHVVNALSGFFVGVAVISLIRATTSSNKQSFIFIVCILSTFIASLLWEVFEVKSGINIATDAGYVSNTIGDLIFNVIGGGFAFWWYRARGGTQPGQLS